MAKTMTKKEAEEFFTAMEALAEERELTIDQVKEAFNEAMTAGCKRMLESKACTVRVEFDEEKRQVHSFIQYLVVDEYSLDADKNYTQLLLPNAREINKKAKVGEIIEQEVVANEFGLFAIRDFKNKFNEVLIKMRKDAVYDYFKSFETDMIMATVIEETEDFIRLDLGKDMTTLLPKKEMLPNDKFRKNEKVRVYVVQVEYKSKWPKIFVSRTNTGLINRLFEHEIPEIKDGTIEVMGISRDAGDRSKIGVKSNDPKVDPIGACVGEGGSRIRNIVAALSGEKIDLFRWSDNERELIANSLQPADVVAVTRVNPRDKSALAIVPDNQLSLAIGKLGQNVKLAVQATGWSIDIKSEQQVQDEGIIY